MKISFDNLRKTIAAEFNTLVEEIRSEELNISKGSSLSESVHQLRCSVGILLCCFDQDQMPDDFNDLSGEIKLLEL
jgi:hypothetical protein